MKAEIHAVDEERWDDSKGKKSIVRSEKMDVTRLMGGGLRLTAESREYIGTGVLGGNTKAIHRTFALSLERNEVERIINTALASGKFLVSVGPLPSKPDPQKRAKSKGNTRK